jgi:hypothetical protein
MKLTIPDLLKIAVETNNMELVAKAYHAITGKIIQVRPMKHSLQPQFENKFVDDGSIAKKDSIKNNPELAKLYNHPVARRDSSDYLELTCSCGTTEQVSQDIAAYHHSNDTPFRCQRCILQGRRS